MSLMTSVRVSESFSPTAQGAESPTKKTNVITPQPGKQAAVTFGAAIGTQALNDAISPSKLFTMGAAYGMISYEKMLPPVLCLHLGRGGCTSRWLGTTRRPWSAH
jgi:hypothetical protein